VASLAPIARRNDSALRAAIVASLALHALLLIGAPVLQESFVAPAAPPLQGRLIDTVVVPMPEEATAPAKAKSRARAKPVPPVEAAPVPAAMAAATEPEAPRETPSSSPPPVAAAPAGAPAAAVPGVPAAAGTAPHAVEPRSVGEYRVLLIGAAGRYKRYPALARENSWTGEVQVGINVGSDGTPSFSVKKGSGHEVLDRQALDMFGQAARDVPVPTALRGQAFVFSVRAIYGLED